LARVVFPLVGGEGCSEKSGWRAFTIWLPRLLQNLTKRARKWLVSRSTEIEMLNHGIHGVTGMNQYYSICIDLEHTLDIELEKNKWLKVGLLACKYLNIYWSDRVLLLYTVFPGFDRPYFETACNIVPFGQLEHTSRVYYGVIK
jgi:hypothetical protein